MEMSVVLKVVKMGGGALVQLEVMSVWWMDHFARKDEGGGGGSNGWDGDFWTVTPVNI
jgi:hypothetical protein